MQDSIFFRNQSSVTKRIYLKLSAHERIALPPKPPTPDTNFKPRLHKKFTFIHLMVTDIAKTAVAMLTLPK